jgi:hypothetical protein
LKPQNPHRVDCPSGWPFRNVYRFPQSDIMPIVSIIIPLHNKEPFVAETILSVLAQSLLDWELIVVENGSTDKGPEIVRQFSDGRIRLVASPKCGPGAARNVGILEAKGEWLSFLDADDLLQPNHLENLLRCAANEDRADLVAGRWRKFTRSPTELLDAEKPSCEGKTHRELLDSAIAFAPWAVHAVLVRRSVVSEKLWWPEHLDRFLGEDIAFWFKLLNNISRWICGESAGALYRWKTVDCRTKNEDVQKWFDGLHHATNENLAFLRELGQEPTACQCENLMRLYEGLYLLALREGNRAVAGGSLDLARHWLRLSLQQTTGRHALQARRIVGFRLFNIFKKCARSQT